MFYKFMGGSDADLLAVFDHAVVNGSLKFTSGPGSTTRSSSSSGRLHLVATPMRLGTARIGP